MTTPDGHRCNIPDCDMLAESCFLEESMRKQIYLFSAAFLTALAPIFVALAWYAPAIPTLHIALLLYTFLPLNVLWTWRRRDYRGGLAWLHGVNFTVILAIAVIRPGIATPQMWWLVSIPFVCLLSGLRRLGLALEVVVLAYLAWLFLRSGGEATDGTPSAALRSHAAVALSSLYVCGHLVFAMRWRDKLQRELQDAQIRVASSSAAKARFLASVSHEIRTPLNGVIGAAELLRRPGIQEGQRHQLAALQEQSAKTLLALINDILDWSKLDVGKMALDLQPTYLRGLVFEVNELFAIAAFTKGLELTSSCDESVPRLFQADSTRIRQVVTNLVGNAVKFTQEGGVHIHVSIETAHPTARTADQVTVRIDVLDSGIGIQQASIGQLFVAFQQADLSVTRRFGGTGLGLAICRELVRLMDGEIVVTSTPGVGSTFSVLLPLLPYQDEPEKTQTTMLAQGKTLLATSSRRLQAHVSPLLHELRIDHVGLGRLPDVTELEPYSHLLLDAALIGGDMDLQSWIDVCSASVDVALLVPLGADAMRGTFPNATIVYKPVRRSALAGFFRVDSADAAQPDAPGTVAGPDVLVCEDNPVNQVIVQAMLTELGAKCTIASDGLEALALQSERSFDLVLMDCQMPNMDGSTATQKWRQIERGTGRRTPIIAMTANSAGEEFAACRTSGMDDLLAKPFGISSLERCLQKWARPSQHRLSEQADVALASSRVSA